MKIILKTILFILIINSYNILTSQVTVTTVNPTVNGVLISNCGTINLATNPTTNVTLWIRLTKNSNQVVGNGFLYIYRKNNITSTTESLITSKQVLSGDWILPTEYNTTENIVLNHNDFNNTTGGVLYIKYVSSSNVEYFSCNFNVTKQETPTFTISPCSLNLNCGDTSDRTFTVTNVYNSAGTKSYKWQVGNSWLYNGNSAPNEITTTTNTILLTPNTFPLSNVSVATILNGTQLPYSSSNVNLTPIENKTIEGDVTVCSSEILSINNLTANESVVWSSSNTNIASISTSNNQATVYANGTGIVTITATISNSCGQQLPINKTVTLGVPTDYYDANIDVHPYPGNYGGIYLNNWTRMWMTNYPSGLNWNWTANYSMIQNPDSPQPLIKPLSNGYMTIKVRKSNKCGYGSWVSKNFYVTPLPDGGFKIQKF